MSAIGEHTPVKVGLVIAVGGFVIATVWWAATLQTKVDTLLSGMNKYEVQAVKISELSTRLDLVDQIGTKHERDVASKLAELERRMFILESARPK